MCVKADLNDSAQWCYQMSCIVFLLQTIEIYIQSADWHDERIKGLVSGFTDENQRRSKSQWPVVIISNELHCVCVVHSWNLHSISWQAGFKFLLATVPSDVIKWSVLFVFKHTNANFPAQCECTLTPTLLKFFLQIILCAQLDTLKHHCALPGSATVLLNVCVQQLFSIAYVHEVWCMVYDFLIYIKISLLNCTSEIILCTWLDTLIPLCAAW